MHQIKIQWHRRYGYIYMAPAEIQWSNNWEYKKNIKWTNIVDLNVHTTKKWSNKNASPCTNCELGQGRKMRKNCRLAIRLNREDRLGCLMRESLNLSWYYVEKGLLCFIHSQRYSIQWTYCRRFSEPNLEDYEEILESEKISLIWMNHIFCSSNFTQNLKKYLDIMETTELTSITIVQKLILFTGLTNFQNSRTIA